MFKKSVSILLASALTIGQVSCRSDSKPAESEVEAVQVAAYLVVIGWEAIAGYLAVGGAITIGGITLWTFSKPDVVTAEFERQTKEENSALASQYNQYSNAIKATPNSYVSAMKMDRKSVAKLFESSRIALLRSRSRDYKNGGCVVATVISTEGGSSGARWEGKEGFSSEFDVIAAQFSATAKAYGKCFKDAMINNAEFRGAVEEIVMQESIPDNVLEGAYTVFFLMNKVGKDLVKACGAPSYAYTYNKASCQ